MLVVVEVDVATLAADPHAESTRDPPSNAGRMSKCGFIVTNRFVASRVSV
jgi:hypothetical protein